MWVLETRIKQLKELLSSSEPVPLPTDTRAVAVGHVVTFERQEGKKWKPVETVMLDGETRTTGCGLQIVRYTVKPYAEFLGRQVGETFRVEMNEETVTIRIMGIRVPEPSDFEDN